MALPSPFSLLAQSWKFYRSHLITLLKLIIVPPLLTLILVGMAALVVFAGGSSQLVIIPALLTAAIAAVVISLLGRLALLGFIHRPDNYTGLLSFYKAFWQFLGKFLATQVLAGLFILLGLILLIIPGLVLAVRYLFVPFIVIAEGKSGRAALSQSSQAVKGKFWGVAGRSLFIGLLSLVISGIATQIDNTIIASILQILMALVIAPLTTIYFYHLYQASKLEVDDLTSRRPAPAANP
jgi:hypothetical protein